ncbi:MAG TPA: cytochrome c [bacterium]|nr:cytochrome c [bacterium]
MTKRRILIGFIALLGLPLPAIDAAGFEPGAYFEKTCSSCHKVGGGDDIGPDLKGVTDRRKREWLVPFIQSSQTVIQSGDPVATGLFNKFKQKKMPDQDLTPQDINALLDFIAAGGPKEVAIDLKPATAATPADIQKGLDLFTGRIPLAAGGAACISCHSAGDVGPLGGGTMGLNLTQAYSKYEDKGLSKALKRPGFLIMKDYFADKPLTDDEAFALKAFLYDVDRAGTQGGNHQKKFLFLGLGGTVVMMGATDFIWRKRRRKSAKPWSRQSGL